MEVLAPKISGRLVLPWEPLKLMPIGDIQYSGENGSADMARLAKHIAWGVENGCYFVGMGDYIDFLSPSNRQRLKEAAVYDTAEQVIDNAATELEQAVQKALAPSVGRWLTVVEGHHYFNHLDGTTTGQRLAQFLGCQYGGDCTLLRLTFKLFTKAGAPGVATNTKLFVHHGHGGATTIGGILTALERKLLAAFPSVQLFFIGHFHQVIPDLKDALDVTDRGVPKLYHYTRGIVLTGSFMKGWTQGNRVGNRPQGSYVEQRMLPPAMLGGPLVTLTPKRIDNGSLSLVDIRVSV